MLVSFESNFSYTSRLLSDFDVSTLTLRVTEDATINDDGDLLLTTEAVDDLSIFAESDEVILTHQASIIPYNGFLDTSFNYNGVEYDRVYNPIMMTSSGTSQRFVGFVAQRSSDGQQARFLYREEFGVNATATPLLIRYEDDNVEPLVPSMLSVDAATSNTRLYWTNGGANDPEIFYSRYRVNGGGSNSQTEVADITGFEVTNPNIGHTIHSWADTSYTVIGNGNDEFAVVGVNHSGLTDSPFLVDDKSSTVGSSMAVASARVEDDLFVAANGSLYKYNGDQDISQAEDKLDHSGTPGTLSPNIVATYTGHYFTRMFFDEVTQKLYLVGGTGTTGVLPATYTSQTIYETDVNLTALIPVGTFDVGYYTNQYVFRLSDSQLWMFPGAASTTMFDSDLGQLVDTRARLQENGDLFDPSYQLTGGMKVSREAGLSYLTIKTSPPGLQDYLNPTFAFATVNSF